MTYLNYVVDGNKIKFYFENRVYLGYAYKEIDGSYVFLFDDSGKGSWSDYTLREIADKLTELNKDWEKQIEKAFYNKKSKIFEKREYVDGGPFDRGKCIGFIKASSLEEARLILNVNHGFIQLMEISEEDFSHRKEEAHENYKMYLI